jgi:radical SAM protein with 4Fe4S-binding SPASM domain
MILRDKSPEEILLEEIGDSYREYRKRWHDANNFIYRPSFPIHVDIETHYACNLKCIMCPYGDPEFIHPSYRGTFIDMQIVKGIIRSGVRHGLSSLRFSGLNEPLLYRGLPEIIGFAKCSGILDLFITTNGLLLTEDVSYALIKSGVTHLMVSLDAASSETYSEIRKGGNYHKVVNNICRFIEIRSKLQSRLPLLRLSFTKMKPNLHEVNKFIEKWSNVADYIAITGYLDNISNRDTHNTLTVDRDRNQRINSYKCSQPWSRAAIFANGDVFPCCMNYGRYASVGNVYEKELVGIWRSKQVKFIQDVSKSGEYFKCKICKECISKRDVFEESC